MSLIYHRNKKKLNKDVEENINKVSKNLEENIKYIKNILSRSSDIKYRPVKITSDQSIDGYIFFIDGMIDSTFLSENILSSLINFSFDMNSNGSVHEKIYNQLLSVGNVKIIRDLDSLIMDILSGHVGLLVENESAAISVKAEKLKERAVEEPSSETVVKGMRTGFVENIRTNTSLIRRIIKSPKLKNERFSVGRISNTEINIMYIEGIVAEELVEEVKKRIKRIDTDCLLTINTLQEMIEDSVISPFSLSFSTERPDKVCSCLMEGRIAIILANSPFVMIIPTTIVHTIQSTEDYNTKSIVASFIRLLRFIALCINMLLPGLYVAILSFHHEMIPTSLLKAVSVAREELPFTIFLEMLLLLYSFEILREAGVRLPRAVGQAVSIVGALVIGQAAVSAKLVSPPSIIIVALTAICSFTIPLTEVSNTFRILPFFLLLAGGIIGIPGIISAFLIIIIHLSGLRSFGVPYLNPISPFSATEWKDFLIRLPMLYMKKRPTQTAKSNLKRQGNWKRRK